MFNNDVLEAIELLRKEIRNAQRDSQDVQRSKVKTLVDTIIKEIATKETKELKEREQYFREKYFELASTLKGLYEEYRATKEK